ncbi:MAG TPA: PRC-barrel domain-containing protein, partial [Clostridia bacterium]|nr:PRC-barrel domain-containing protein [Clostridia bacterium]
WKEKIKMKTHKLTLAAVSTAIALSMQPVSAQETETESKSTTSAKTMSGVKLSKLMEAQIQSSDGEDLGKLQDVLINKQTGQIDFAVLGQGGFLGMGEKLVPIPWKALNVKSETEFTLNVDKEKMASAPTMDKSYSSIHDPAYTVTVYRFFAVPADVGGAEPPGGVESGKSPSETYGSSTNGSSSYESKEKDE